MRARASTLLICRRLPLSRQNASHASHTAMSPLNLRAARSSTKWQRRRGP